MIKERLNNYLLEILREQNTGNNVQQYIELYKAEREYIEQNNMMGDEIIFTEKDSQSRFNNAYIERCEKNTDEMISEESVTFLDNSLEYLKQHKNEFIYLESNWFNLIGVDGVSLELDDVFATFNTMFGLKVQKKYEEGIRTYLQDNLIGTDTEPEMQFNYNDGIWDINVSINYIDGFKEEMTLNAAYQLLYLFLFRLVENVEREMGQK